MAWWMAAAAVGSAIAQSEAERKSARATRQSLDKAQQDKIRAADSVLYASTINRSLAEARGRETQSSQITSFASSGVDITSGSVLSTLASTETQILRNDFLAEQQAQAEADLMIAQGEQYAEQGRLAEKNAKDKRLFNFIGAGMQAGASYGK